MQKVYISVPCVGRKQKDIQDTINKIEKTLTGLYDKELQFEHTVYIPDQNDMWNWSYSLQKMSTCDMFVRLDMCHSYNETRLEMYAANILSSMSEIVLPSRLYAPDVYKKETEALEIAE